MMTLAERRLRVRATMISDIMKSSTLKGDARRDIDELINAQKEYLWLCAAPIDPNKTRGRVV